MTLQKIVNPSDQTQAFLPLFVGENYQTFVNFMAKGAESEERQGFGQDLLQNLNRYRDFDTFADGIVENSVLASGLTEDEVDEIVLESGLGFPLINGVVLIGDEVILYRRREGDKLVELQRAASATVILPSVSSDGKWADGPAANYVTGTSVENISSLFLSAMLSTIHESFTPNIYSDRVSEEVDRSLLLQNIKDFYAAKGTKASIQSLFKFIYGDADVDVLYPGDLMTRPSSGKWQQFLIGTATPFPVGLLGENGERYSNTAILGSKLEFKDYVTGDKVTGTAVVEFSNETVLPDGTSYTLYLDADSFEGEVDLRKAETQSTILKRNLLYYGSVGTIAVDVSTITVDSTNDFPESGVIFIGAEAIRYTSKSNNQFFGCTRAIDGHGSTHAIGSVVYGSKYAELTTASGITKVWMGALYRGIAVSDGGILANVDDTVDVGLPGDTDYRDPILNSLQENTNDTLVTMTNMTDVTDVSDVTVGISAIYYDEDNVYVESSGLPDYDIGPFSTDGSVGPDLKGNASSTHVIPRRSDTFKSYDGTRTATGTGRQGVYIDGTPIAALRTGGKVISGKVTSVDVIAGGRDYGTATAVFEPEGAVGRVTVVSGVVTRVEITTNANYTEIPTVRISEGEGALFDLAFDQWGRLTNVEIVSGGQYFFDVPRLVLDDESGSGIGAVLACSVSKGQIEEVTIINPGLDYRPSTTTIRTITPGTGAEVTANVETYNLNRVGDVARSTTELKDSGNGILVSMNPGGPKDTFAIAERPSNLLAEIDPNKSKHSPIIGWAYDGNPIYGPRGYTNSVDDSDGVIPIASGYALQENRSTVIPEGSDAPGTLPPDEAEYPMGTFIEDYIYDPENAGVVGYILTELNQRLQDDPDSRNIRYQFEFGDVVLDKFNGRVCNTPDFPADKYPNGVYCYFTTIFGDIGVYPYVIGPEFRDVPTSQNTIIYNNRGDVIVSSTEGQANYSDSVVTYYQKNMKRLRSSSIPRLPVEPIFDITQVLPGGVNGVVCIDGSPDNASVRDTFYFNNEGTSGSGAAAIVDELKGRVIETAETKFIQTRLISHTQRINLENDENADSYVFTRGSEILTQLGTRATVINWSYETKYLDVQVQTKRLVRFGDTFFDNKGASITIPTSKFPNNVAFSSETTGGRSTFAGWDEPDYDSANPGDLWWSSRTGRLYINYSDGDSAQWVTTQPSGSRSFYADTPDLPSLSTTETTQSFATPQSETSITISTMAPQERADGTPNHSGDFWWSTHTGMLYIWVVETATDDDTGLQRNNSQWVATDPTAAVAYDTDQGTDLSILGVTPANADVYTERVNILVQEFRPYFMEDGSELVPGTLWWSPATGKMYIYYTDADTSQWVVTNPTTVQTGPDGLDRIIADDGSSLDFITILPYPQEEREFWFEENLYVEDFEPGDIVDIRYGVPGSALVERVRIIAKTSDKGKYKVQRFDARIDLVDGAQVNNVSRYLYKVTCDTDHNLLKRDLVNFTGSGSTVIDGEQEVYRIGKEKKASFTAVLTDDYVSSITIDDPGEGYDERFYLTLSGGEGYGATAVAFVDEDTGSVTSTFVLTNGQNYTSPPTVSHNTELETREFMILIEEDAGVGADGIAYTTKAPQVYGTPSKIRMLSQGLGYLDMPEVVGLVRSEDTEAEVRPILQGTTVAGFNIVKAGINYMDPIVVIDDITEAGSGATATARTDENGRIISVTIQNPGENYVEPVVTIVESTGEYIATTVDIARISEIVLVEPGSIVNADSVSYPEILPPLRIVVAMTGGDFTPEEKVWQGQADGDGKRLFNAEVVSYNPKNHVLTLTDIDGDIDTTEPLYGESTYSARVLSYDDADFVLSTEAFVKPEGRFVDGIGSPSDKGSVIQDSYFYQNFSYVIASSQERSNYFNIVNKTTHPAGNIMFSELRLESRVELNTTAETAIIG
jgi:hypothetical protein